MKKNRKTNFKKETRMQVSFLNRTTRVRTTPDAVCVCGQAKDTAPQAGARAPRGEPGGEARHVELHSTHLWPTKQTFPPQLYVQKSKTALDRCDTE